MGETVLISKGLPSCIRAGEILGEKYRLERELGRGAMGTVWAAMHLSLGQRVAIKLIAAEHAQSSDARTRFSTEAKAAARLRSRHVVQVYDDGETPEGTPYIVMEYLEGETLEARLEREKDVPLVDAVRITAQVARALSRAHAQGVIHRDLKPGNVFLARNDDDELGWTAKVLDFGIAKFEEQRDVSTTKTGVVLGTPLFMSPEQVRGAGSVDCRADLYSLGMCFYNMVTGRYAYESESFGDILVNVCTADLPDIRGPAPWLSDGVAAWFRRCCARDPRDRFQSADELVEALHSAIGGSVPLVSPRATPDTQLGPSGTIKGHGGPVPGYTVPASAEDSGGFTLRSNQASEPDLETGDADPSQAAVNDGEGARPSERRSLIPAMLVTLAVASATGVALALLWQSKGTAELPTAAATPLSNEAAPAKPKPLPPTPRDQETVQVPLANPAGSTTASDVSVSATEVQATPSPEPAPGVAPRPASPPIQAKKRTEPRPQRRALEPSRPPKNEPTATDLGF